jgi:hypothetical protein
MRKLFWVILVFVNKNDINNLPVMLESCKPVIMNP